ncbi:hypothetical protein GCM10010520_62050 [Rhizobium viscosum]
MAETGYTDHRLRIPGRIRECTPRKKLITVPFVEPAGNIAGDELPRTATIRKEKIAAGIFIGALAETVANRVAMRMPGI